jgi:hypothetical protein
MWAVSRMQKNSPSHFCDCLKCAQAGVRSGIVAKEKDIFHFRLGQTLWMQCHRLFKVSLYRLLCALKLKQGVLQQWYTASYSTLAKVCLKQ